MKPELMFVGGFDTRITDRHTVTEFEDIRELKFKGGGGTSLGWLNKFIQKNSPDVMIIFSDLYVSYPKKPKGDTDYIWVIIDNKEAEAPFGQGIHYTSEE
jgi:predicted metal-dependent peptidase